MAVSLLLVNFSKQTIHHQNIQKLAIKIYKMNDLKAPEIMTELFSQVNLPKDIKFCSCNVKTVPYGTAAP